MSRQQALETRARRSAGGSDSAHAVALYGAILTDWPHDLLALAVAHALDFHLGRRRMMLDRIAKVLPHWTDEMPGYASVLAMYAFARSKKTDSTVASVRRRRRAKKRGSIRSPFIHATTSPSEAEHGHERGRLAQARAAEPG
jgi:hypothetical protein